jgi:hypothetical protein
MFSVLTFNTDPRSPTTHSVQMMEIEAHFSADPYQLPVATVHYLSQGPVVHASPQVIEKLDNSEEAAQNAINADLRSIYFNIFLARWRKFRQV